LLPHSSSTCTQTNLEADFVMNRQCDVIGSVFKPGDCTAPLRFLCVLSCLGNCTGLTRLELARTNAEFDVGDLLKPRLASSGVSEQHTTWGQPDSSSRTASRSAVPNLRQLDISCGAFQNPASLSSLTDLERLEMRELCVPDTSTLLSTISQLTQMTTMRLPSLKEGSITTQELKAALKPLTRLQELTLGSVQSYIHTPEVEAAPADHQDHEQPSDQCFFAGLSFPRLQM